MKCEACPHAVPVVGVVVVVALTATLTIPIIVRIASIGRAGKPVVSREPTTNTTVTGLRP